MSYDYQKTFKIELLNELSYGVTGRLISYMTKKKINNDSKNNIFVALFTQFNEMLTLNLFDMELEELEQLEIYWTSMSAYVDTITSSKKVVA